MDLVWFLIAFNFGAMIASTYVNWNEQDEPEHPDFGNTMDKKHREMHSDIMRSSKNVSGGSLKRGTSRQQQLSPGQGQKQLDSPDPKSPALSPATPAESNGADGRTTPTWPPTT